MPRKDSKLEQLGRMWLFSACSNKEISTIGRASDEVSVTKGKVLCEEGRPGHEFFLILDGQASVRANNRKVASLGAGNYFGELALLSREPRDASVIADSDMKLLILGQREFTGLLDSIPGLASKILATMAKRLREADLKSHRV